MFILWPLKVISDTTMTKKVMFPHHVLVSGADQSETTGWAHAASVFTGNSFKRVTISPQAVNVQNILKSRKLCWTKAAPSYRGWLKPSAGHVTDQNKLKERLWNSPKDPFSDWVHVLIPRHELTDSSGMNQRFSTFKEMCVMTDGAVSQARDHFAFFLTNGGTSWPVSTLFQYLNINSVCRLKMTPMHKSI